jgi:hypothetical protein
MPPVRVLRVDWGANETYATRRATTQEIREVFSNSPVIRGNRRGRTASHVAIGVTDAGRKLTVAFIYAAATRTAVPITSWET